MNVGGCHWKAVYIKKTRVSNNNLPSGRNLRHANSKVVLVLTLDWLCPFHVNESYRPSIIRVGLEYFFLELTYSVSVRIIRRLEVCLHDCSVVPLTIAISVSVENMSFSSRPFVSRAKKAPAYWTPTTRDTVLATGVQTNNVFSLMHSLYYEKDIAVETRTNAQDGGIYVLKGQCSFNVGGVHQFQGGPGQFIGIPKLTQYSYVVEATDTELLFFYTPAGPEQIVIGAGHPAVEAGPPPTKLPTIPEERIETLASQYDLNRIGGHKTKSTLHASPSPILQHETAAYWVQPAIPELWIQLATGTQTDNAYTLTEMLFAHGNAAAPLSYGSRDEIYYILDGNAAFLLGDHVEQATNGDFVFIPRGTVFALRVDSQSMRALVWHTPSGIIEGTLPIMMTGGQSAGQKRSLPPPEDLKRPQVDLATFVAQARALGINLLAVKDPLKQ